MTWTARALCVSVACAAVAACGGPAAPSDRSTAVTTTIGGISLPLGPYELYVAVDDEQGLVCTRSGGGLVGFVSLTTNVTLSQDGSDWVARSTTPDNGNIDLRFHETGGQEVGGSGVVGSVYVSGTLTGTGIPNSDNSRGTRFWQTVSFAGVGNDPHAQVQGMTGTSISPVIVFGKATGLITMVDAQGQTVSCSALTEWSIQPGSGT
jgi:hypothetical protein